MPNPYILLALVLAWIGSLAGVGYWQNEAGHTAERVVWQARDNAELAKANQTIHDTEEKYRAEERSHVMALEAIGEAQNQKDQDNEKKTASLIAAAHAGAYRLSDPGTPANEPVDYHLSKVASGPGLGNGSQGRELSKELAAFLTSEAGRADGLVEQLSSCQQIIQDDRK